MLTTAHIQRVEPWIPGLLNDLGSSWVKIVDPGQFDFGQFAQRSLCRIWTDDVDAGYIARGRQGGRDFVRAMYPRWQAVGADAFELANEPDCNTNDGLANLREYTLGAVEEAVRLSIGLCILNVPEGNPHDNGTGDPGVSAWKWAQLRPALQACADAGMWLGRHCYWRPQVEGPTGRWHALGRLEWDLEVLDVPGLKVLVNECGIDGGIAGHPGQQGWQALTTPAGYRQETVEAERYARSIEGVESLMYFTYGYEPPWQTFNIYWEFADSLVAPLKELGDGGQQEALEDASGHLRIELSRPLAITPATNVVTQWFGANAGMYSAYGLVAHNGIDYRAPEGTPVLAMHSGYAQNYDQGNIGLGKYVKITYRDGRGKDRFVTRYAHLSQWSGKDGRMVKRGDVIGLSGNTGNSTGPHLHVDLRIIGGVNPGYGDCIDPVPFRTVG